MDLKDLKQKEICGICEYNHNGWACIKYNRFLCDAWNKCDKKNEIENYKEEDIEWI